MITLFSSGEYPGSVSAHAGDAVSGNEKRHKLVTYAVFEVPKTDFYMI